LRGVALIVVTSFVAGAAFATQDALPESPLHNVKIATEIVRLSLAQSSEHLVAVELDIAEARLREAAALQALDRPIEAAAAVSAYGEHLASAAAHLEVSGTTAESAAVDQFRADVVRQQQGIAGAAGRGPGAASETALGIAGEVAATIRQDDRIGAQDIAAAAATAADKAATTIEKKTAPGVRPPTSSTAAAPRTSAPASPAAAQSPVAPHAPGSAAAAGSTGASATTAPAQVAPATPPSTTAAQAKTPAPAAQSDAATSEKAKAEAAAKAAREAADRAKQAADRAKAAAKSTRDEREKQDTEGNHQK
jgi:hypothetical protein